MLYVINISCIIQKLNCSNINSEMITEMPDNLQVT